MRRFEYSEGTSHKFWEIEIADGTVTTRWGRIGSAGQSKTRDLGGSEAAEREARKQIASKTRKGYAEVAGAEPVAPPPVALADESTFVLPSSWKARIHARRGSAFVPADQHDAAKLWAKVLELAPDKVRADLERRGLTERPAGADVGRLGAILSKLAPENHYRNDGAADTAVRAMLGCVPLADVVSAVLGTKKLQGGWRMDRVPGSLALRRAIAAASDDDYAKALQAARQIRDGGLPAKWSGGTTGRGLDAGVRLLDLSAYLFPTEGWWRASASPPAVMMTCPDDAAEAAAIQAGSYGLPAGALETAALDHGAGAVPMIAHALQHDADQKKVAARVLVELPCDQAMACLLDHIDDKPVAAVLSRAVERFPQRALRLGLPRKGAVLLPLVRSWVAQFPEAVDAIYPDLDPAAQGSVDAIREALASALPDAELSALHWMFRDPPWAKRAKRTKAVEVTPELLPFRLELDEAEAAVLANVRAQADAVAGEAGLQRAALGQRWNPPLATCLQAIRDRGELASTAAEKIVGAWFYGGRAQELVVGAFGLVEPELAARLVFDSDGTEFQKHLAPVAHPRVAENMLSGIVSKTRRELADEWVRRHPDYAARAWVPLAVGRPSKSQRSAVAALRRMKRVLGHGDCVAAAAAHYGPEAEAALTALLDTDPLQTLPAKRPKTIGFWTPGALPRPKLADRAEVLPLEALHTVAMVLAMSPLDDPYAGLQVLKDQLDPGSMEDFTWALFQQWLSTGAPSKEGWALAALGHFGGDRVAGLLTPLIRAWPGESQHARAVAGLDVLLAIGTDVALMHLNGVAQKVKYKGIKAQARERIQKLAVSLGLTRDELADRLVPELGLEPDGTMLLDYGPRQFTVGFDESLKPFVRDAADGKRRKTLPKPGVKDDAAVAGPAQARFKQLCKDVRTLGKLQIQRLETAMITGRRWSGADFEQYLVRHPLLVHLVRRLIWGVFDPQGALQTSFRVAEDRSFADSEDEDFALPDGTIGVLHPVDTSADLLAAWGEILADYELLQPFAQLARPTHRLQPGEADETVLVRHPKRRVAVGRVLGLLSKGWERGEAQDGGVVHWLSLPLPDGARELRMHLGEAGLWTGMGAEQDELPTIEGVCVVERGSWDWNPKGVEALGRLPPALVSEVLSTLEALHAG